MQQPSIHAGPIVRRLTANEMVLWLVCDKDYPLQPEIHINGTTLPDTHFECQKWPLKVGKQATIITLQISFKQPLRNLCQLQYQLHLQEVPHSHTLTSLLPDLCYTHEDLPTLVFKEKIDHLLHGSCRKPHHFEKDGLLRVDELLRTLDTPESCPGLLLMTGDQVYVDDVAGPMLQAVQQVSRYLGLFNERIPGAVVSDSEDLPEHPYNYYKRNQLLPYLDQNEEVEEAFFSSKKKPIFTSVNAANHLISLSEVLAMYFLVWSPALWSQVKLTTPESLSAKEQLQFQKEQQAIEAFANDLSAVRRALAHIPTYMIFDDHDITDDWNLTRGWEEAAYGNAFSRRIIGNALMGYFLCQGFANDPQRCAPLWKEIKAAFSAKQVKDHETAVKALFSWSHWHYCLPTDPGIVVLDTRTHRWRSEDDPDKPSGLMDWEALTELQSQLVGKKSVIVVSAAPIFGVKVIEAIQRIFTAFGQALTVDAENWMAHPGTANVLLNIFKHTETPTEFVILSGDVHYSFCYDIRLRFRQSSPQIHQITCSGIKNQFPTKLLAYLDGLNRLLYGQYSPLNWFTKRRRMEISVRQPKPFHRHRSLISKSGIGQVFLDEKCSRPVVSLLCSDGEQIQFPLRENKSTQK
ncbi:MAG: alkaline phosphatase family protein [Aestuariibacter sp.]